MRIRRLEELRKIHLDIKAKLANSSSADIKNQEEMIFATVKQVIDLAKIARREGLLALEEVVEGIAVEAKEEALKQLIILMVDGTEPQILEEIGLSRYYSHLYTDYGALQYFIYLEGVLSIQAGENLTILEERLKVMLPVDMYVSYSFELEKAKQEEKQKKEKNLIQNLCKGEPIWNSEGKGYYVYKLLDYLICDMSDKELQRVLREIENTTLELAMKGMSGNARKHIFSNTSERLANLIAEDMMSMGIVQAVDILEASQKILNVTIRLIELGEISERYEYLEPFYQVFRVDTVQQRQKNNKIAQLKMLVEEYEQGAELVKEV